ncbi:integrase arm-type DNA-binding domain-containing protein [Methylosinus sp. RM1]|uniref:integrase arm-type DNA-binding domain-containing protein n=1 Tax=Methylosinus sp. RM1 TaxID=2583817 RepID=UPI00140DA250|nr:integrase arm-type DNA-binding domain-containing protein [Methylosinus sp. RM1]
MGEKLSEAFIKAFALPSGKDRLEISDEGCRGLRLRISPTDRTFYFFGAPKGSTKPQRVKLGRWPDMKLKEAQAACAAVRAKVIAGERPPAPGETGRVRRSPNSSINMSIGSSRGRNHGRPIRRS